MSYVIQGMDMLGIKSEVDADLLNAIRGNLLNAIGIDNLKATNLGTADPDSQIKNTCDRVRLWDPSGNTPALAKDVDVTVDLSTTGAGGLDTGSVAADEWYYRWLIGKCTAGDGRAAEVAALASLSASAPALPAGYTHRRPVGPCRTDDAGHLKGFFQSGADWIYAERQLAVHRTSTIARTTQSLADFMPPESKIAHIKFRSEALTGSSQADGWLWVHDIEDWIVSFDADYLEESQTTLWMPAPTGELDYAWSLVSSSGTLDIWVQAFRWPINTEP